MFGEVSAQPSVLAYNPEFHDSLTDCGSDVFLALCSEHRRVCYLFTCFNLKRDHELKNLKLLGLWRLLKVLASSNIAHSLFPTAHLKRLLQVQDQRLHLLEYALLVLSDCPLQLLLRPH